MKKVQLNDTLAIKAYGGLTRLLAPLLPRYLKKRAARGKEDPERLPERFGRASMPRPIGHLVWLHGASVGETVMLLPLIEKILERAHTHVLLTSGTVTSAELMEKRLPEGAIHQYVPVDTPAAVSRFLDHWKPDLALWAESEIWPNLLRLTKRRGITTALVNARMSEGSIRRWHQHGLKNAQKVFANFDHIFVANKSTAHGLASLLSRSIPLLGNLKNAAPELPADAITLTSLKDQIGTRPVWCAASTHKGEDEIILAAHKQVLDTHSDALLILVPRHPERTEDVQELVQKAGQLLAVRSKGETISKMTEVFLLDTIGELGLAFRLAPLTVMCGSLIDGLSGHNPLEPARLGSAVLSGTHVASFKDTYDAMFKGAAMPIANPNGLGAAISALLGSRRALAKAQNLAKDFAEDQDGVLDAVWERLEPLMPTGKFKVDMRPPE